MKTFLKITLGVAALGLCAASVIKWAPSGKHTLLATARPLAAIPAMAQNSTSEFNDFLADPTQIGAFSADAPATNEQLENMLGLSPGTLQSVTPGGNPNISIFPDGAPLILDWPTPSSDVYGTVVPTNAIDNTPSPSSNLVLLSPANSNPPGGGGIGLMGPYVGSVASNYYLGSGGTGGGGSGGGSGSGGSSGNGGSRGGEGILGDSGRGVTPSSTVSAVPLPASSLMAPLAFIVAAAAAYGLRKSAKANG